MPKKRKLGALRGEEVKWLLKKHPKLRSALKALDLKLTVNGRILGTPKSGCKPPGWKGGSLPPDSLIARPGQFKSGK